MSLARSLLSSRGLTSCTCRASARSSSLSSNGRAQHTHLKSRGVLRVSGPDSKAFLQGLVTNDVGLSHHESRQHVYAAFLNAQGRIVSDVFIHRDPDPNGDGNSYYIDHDASLTGALRSQIQRFILRAKVKVHDVSEQYQVEVLWLPAEHDLPEDEARASYDGAEASPWQDTRTPHMGQRALRRADWSPIASEAAQEVPESSYYQHRIYNGVPEGPLDMQTGVAIASEMNMDWMGGIDFRKGCYVGQELTARSHHTGLIRKRIMPVILSQGEESRLTASSNATAGLMHYVRNATLEHSSEGASLPQPHTDVRLEHASVARPRPVGKVGSSMLTSPRTALGLALLRLEHLRLDESLSSRSLPTFIVAPASNAAESGVNPAGGLQNISQQPAWTLTPFLPPWWLQHLQDERK